MRRLVLSACGVDAKAAGFDEIVQLLGAVLPTLELLDMRHNQLSKAALPKAIAKALRESNDLREFGWHQCMLPAADLLGSTGRKAIDLSQMELRSADVSCCAELLARNGAAESVILSKNRLPPETGKLLKPLLFWTIA